MIIVDCEQSTPEWFNARLGIPTASNFGKILTAGGKHSTSRTGYADSLLADWLAGKPVDQMDTTRWMERGNELEQQARDNYSFETGNEVEQIGFVYLDVKQDVGCSPDGLIRLGQYEEITETVVNHLKKSCPDYQVTSTTNVDRGLVEIKCPKASTLVGYYGKKCPAKYVPQVQGQLWICEREWCDFYGYHPDLLPYMIRVERDENYIKLLAEAVAEFVAYLNKRKKALKEWRM